MAERQKRLAVGQEEGGGRERRLGGKLQHDIKDVIIYKLFEGKARHYALLVLRVGLYHP